MRNKGILQKVEIFVWRVSQKRIPARVELDKRGIDLDTIICPLYLTEPESVDHILSQCPRVIELWNHVLKWWNIPIEIKVGVVFAVVPNLVAFCYLFNGFSQESFVIEERKLHCYTITCLWFLTDAKRSFDVIPTKDVIYWGSMVASYAYNGLASNALKIFFMMLAWRKKQSVCSFFVYLANSVSEDVIELFGLMVDEEDTGFNFMKLVFPPQSMHCQNHLIVVGQNTKRIQIQNDDIDFSRFPSWSSEYGSKYLVNVDSFGAVGDGVSDDTTAFSNAWKQACSTTSAVLLVPPDRTYLVNATRFKGPCAEDFIIQIDGTIVAPNEPKNWDPKNPRIWLYFSNLTRAHFLGNGVIDGSGSKWWAASCKRNKTNPCVGAPTALTIDQSSSIEVNGLTIQNSQQMHFAVSRSESVRIYNVVVSAPEDSPNTDGIHLTASKNVVIEDSKIGTGDDCVSIVSGCSNIKMKTIYCGPGHGISIGSLGKGNSTDFVTAVVLDTAIIKGATNGLRIKTWQGGSGYVRAVRYQNVQMVDVANPIIIDQFYCDSPKTCQNQTSAVEISQIMYQNISGTSKSPNAMMFACSDTVPCDHIVLNNINLRRTDGKTAGTFCNSVKGFKYGYVQPPADCLMPIDDSLIKRFEHNETEREHLIHSEL
ncbi:probable polygalacturonase At1g80170 [Rutidosis leptorrhynchoides]|uniref:probable polygalacturonase At1g80170 n=1 Tax=Rutidosis leptorrhynchoides TaxID=125765 RepID=UPI003A98F800